MTSSGRLNIAALLLRQINGSTRGILSCGKHDDRLCFREGTLVGAVFEEVEVWEHSLKKGGNEDFGESVSPASVRKQ